MAYFDCMQYYAVIANPMLGQVFTLSKYIIEQVIAIPTFKSVAITTLKLCVIKNKNLATPRRDPNT